MKNPTVSIVIPVYNVESYLDTCIRSVQNQSYGDWELILVDDGSTDRSPRICDEYARKDKRITVIHKTNGGQSSARNAGLEHITGEYLAFLDSDDFWHKDYLQTLLLLCRTCRADIAQCGFVRGTATVFPEIEGRVQIRTYDNHTVFLERGANIIMCGKLYRSSLFENIRMPVGKIFEDDFITWKVYYQAEKIVVTTQALYYYTVNPGSTMSRQRKKPRLDFLDAYAERIRFFEERGNVDLAQLSRGHFCLSLMLTACNPNLQIEQYRTVIGMFRENRSRIQGSKYIPISHRILFAAFSVAPRLCAKCLRFIRK